MKRASSHLAFLAAVAAAVALITAGWGQGNAAPAPWPDKNRILTIINPNAAGGDVDTATRILQPFLEKELGIKTVLVNKPGAGNQIGITELVRANPQLPLMENGEPVEALIPRMASANAYLGADAVRDALATGAPVVITGRVADPSLFLGCMLHGLRWSYDDWPRLASGTLAGHMMECAAQLTGGCFIDPGRKDADDPVNIGFPYADVNVAGELVFDIARMAFVSFQILL